MYKNVLLRNVTNDRYRSCINDEERAMHFNYNDRQRRNIAYIRIFFLIFIITLFLFSCATLEKKPETREKPYGVFIGVDSSKMSRLKGYELLIIDAQSFDKDQIEQLHQDNGKIYSYLNIGAIEEFRPYFKKFESLCLSPYENWEDEYWIDARNQNWKDFIVNELSGHMIEKGIDGFFIDNCDLYYHYPQDDMYNALVDILTELKNKHHVEIIVNGADVFISKLMDNKAQKLIDGVNQESVFTDIDFEHGVFFEKEKAHRDYLTEYLKQCKSTGLKVYVLEYADQEELSTKAKAFCVEKGYTHYIAPSLDLNGFSANTDK